MQAKSKTQNPQQKDKSLNENTKQNRLLTQKQKLKLM